MKLFANLLPGLTGIVFLVHTTLMQGTILVKEFVASQNESNVKIQWLFNGSSPAVFVIEKSTDGVNFIVTDSVAAGAVEEEAWFTRNDTNPTEGLSYYRLKFHDGTSTSYSKIVGVEYKRPVPAQVFELVNAYPNPCAGPLRVSLVCKNEMSISINIVGIDGRIISKRQVSCSGGQNNLCLEEVADFAAGQYIVDFAGEYGHQQKLKLLCIPNSLMIQ
jgi:hypothetical protein